MGNIGNKGKRKLEHGELQKDHPLYESLRNLSADLRAFIDLSMNEPDKSWEDWVETAICELDEVRCWEIKDCRNKKCPAFKNTGARCWLLAGTFCDGKPKDSEFSTKFKNCTDCSVYKMYAFRDPVAEIYEHIITLIRSMKTTQDKLRKMAVRDSLTGLYNRNYFNETIVRDIERAKRYKEKLSIIIIDIDGFKRINDTYGHVHGDGILREFSAILKSSVRKSDFLCRFGGDEFVIVTPKPDCGKNAPLLRRIRQSIDLWNSNFGSGDYEMRFSVGCAVWTPGKDLIAVLGEADGRMYADKSNNKSNG